MKKIFWRCIESEDDGFRLGKEYEDAGNGFYTDDGVWITATDANSACDEDALSEWVMRLERIEREVFEVHDQQWFRHTPGDLMPCQKDQYILVILKNGDCPCSKPWKAKMAQWDKCLDFPERAIIGWRYAEAQDEPEELTEAQQDALDFKRDYEDRGCTCFQCAPCSYCTHPGNPLSMEAQGLDEDGYPLVSETSKDNMPEIAAMDERKPSEPEQRYLDKQAELQKAADDRALAEKAKTEQNSRTLGNFEVPEQSHQLGGKFCD